MKKILLMINLMLPIYAYAGMLSPELENKLTQLEKPIKGFQTPHPLNIQVYLKSNRADHVRLKAHNLGIELVSIRFMPRWMVGTSHANRALLAKLAADDDVDLISLLAPSYEELEISTASMLLRQGDEYPLPISNWWDEGITGEKTVIAILDSGVADNYTNANGQSFKRHDGLRNKNFYVNRNVASGFNNYLNGVRTAHGTGVACIYGNEQNDRRGVAFGAKDFLITIAGDTEADETDWALTLKNLDWLLLDASHPKPNVINYSFGNGDVYCATCSNDEDWSAVAQAVDYIVNHYHMTWVKSAGNKGWIAPSDVPHASTLSIPADSYNAIVVANMNNTLVKTEHSLVKTANRTMHTIQATSSRGPTLAGRRKPDITAPGNDTRTCAPDVAVYAVPTNATFKPYTAMMHYDSMSKTRLMGGTSSATPNVGGAAALAYDFGIHSPKMIKALLINSADAWSDNNQPGPGDKNSCQTDLPNCGHHQVEGSHWDRTYGWGYINLDKAYLSRYFVYEKKISTQTPVCYELEVKANEKMTVVWERRFASNGTPYQFTPIRMELFSATDGALIDVDNSLIDNVLQVANKRQEKSAPADSPVEKVILKLSIPSEIQKIDGVNAEPIAIATTSRLKRQYKCRQNTIN